LEDHGLKQYHNSGAPTTVGILMDGNGRWAQARGLARKEGHTKGMINLIKIAMAAFELGAENVVCYSLSTENLNREKDELNHILSLVLDYFDAFVEAFRRKGVCAKFVGRLDLLPEDIRRSLKKTEEVLSEFSASGRTIYMAIAYGSRNEIVDAVNRAIRRGEPVSEQSFLEELALPLEMDLVIRTGGEQRLSNFFLYQLAYGELYFSDRYFPDFSEEDLQEAFGWYASRIRRYGLVL
jgi:undecaprenyl diphosphate synthase